MCETNAWSFDTASLSSVVRSSCLLISISATLIRINDVLPLRDTCVNVVADGPNHRGILEHIPSGSLRSTLLSIIKSLKVGRIRVPMSDEVASDARLLEAIKVRSCDCAAGFRLNSFIGI